MNALAKCLAATLMLVAVATPAPAAEPAQPSPPVVPAAPTLVTDLAPGLSAYPLVRAGETLSDGTPFSPKNDLTVYFPLDARSGFLMVGHEIAWGKDAMGGRFTKLYLKDGKLAGGRQWTTGMHNNCAGGVTPWGTVLSGEEYPHQLMPGKDNVAKMKQYDTTPIRRDDPQASFGWIYEINPNSVTPAGQAKRLTALGRYSHESAEMVGDRTVYLTEDYEGGFFFKFVADRPRDLSSGKLAAYDRAKRRWLPIKDPYNAHVEAGRLGATRFMRLEDVKFGPDKKLYIAETGLIAAKDPYGRVLKLDPETLAMTVAVEGDGKRLANPDNLIFDAKGRLLICEDQYNENIKDFGQNEVLRREPNGALTHLLYTMPGSEPTGPYFTPDYKRMFLSVMAGPQSGVMVIQGL